MLQALKTQSSLGEVPRFFLLSTAEVGFEPTRIESRQKQTLLKSEL